jgi:hypothetical protein
MGEHIDTRNRKKKTKEYNVEARRSRVTFKNYLRTVQEELLEQEMNTPDDDDDYKLDYYKDDLE